MERGSDEERTALFAGRRADKQDDEVVSAWRDEDAPLPPPAHERKAHAVASTVLALI